jgi:hypothetical protein
VLRAGDDQWGACCLRLLHRQVDRAARREGELLACIACEAVGALAASFKRVAVAALGAVWMAATMLTLHASQDKREV